MVKGIREFPASKIIEIGGAGDSENSSRTNLLKRKNKVNEIFRGVAYNEITRVDGFPYNRRSERFSKVGNTGRTAISTTISKRNDKNTKYLYPTSTVYGGTGGQCQFFPPDRKRNVALLYQYLDLFRAIFATGEGGT